MVTDGSIEGNVLDPPAAADQATGQPGESEDIGVPVGLSSPDIGIGGKARTPAESIVPDRSGLVSHHPSSTLARLMGIFRQPPMRYQNTYVWLLLAASLDIMLTGIVLFLGGSEVNWLADQVLKTYQMPGMVVFKFGLVIFVILMCEFVGRMRDKTGQRLATWAVVINFFPVVWTITQLLFVFIMGEGPTSDIDPLFQMPAG